MGFFETIRQGNLLDNQNIAQSQNKLEPQGTVNKKENVSVVTKSSENGNNIESEVLDKDRISIGIDFPDSNKQVFKINGADLGSIGCDVKFKDPAYVKQITRTTFTKNIKATTVNETQKVYSQPIELIEDAGFKPAQIVMSIDIYGYNESDKGDYEKALIQYHNNCARLLKILFNTPYKIEHSILKDYGIENYLWIPEGTIAIRDNIGSNKEKKPFGGTLDLTLYHAGQEVKIKSLASSHEYLKQTKTSSTGKPKNKIESDFYYVKVPKYMSSTLIAKRYMGVGNKAKSIQSISSKVELLEKNWKPLINGNYLEGTLIRIPVKGCKQGYPTEKLSTTVSIYRTK